MAKHRKKASKTRIIKFFPRTALRAEQLKGRIEEKEVQVKNLEKDIAGEKNPGNIVGLNISLCKRRMALFKSEITFFSYLLANKAELNLKVSNKRLWDAINKNNAKIKREKTAAATWARRSKIRPAKAAD